MANYKAYPKAKDTPSRLTRKGDRSKVFAFNKKANRLLKAKRSEFVDIEKWK